MTSTLTAFSEHDLIARGDLEAVTRAAHPLAGQNLIAFDDSTGRVFDLDLRGDLDDTLGRLALHFTPPKPPRGRPKLGVTAREVTLLPRHWEWLAAQPGGASAALRRLVDQARRDTVDTDAVRQAQEVTYRVMTTLSGNLAGYEEAARALFARDRVRFEDLTGAWAKDVAAYVGELTETVWPPSP